MSVPTLLIDVSNSFTKFALADERRLLRRWKAPTREMLSVGATARMPPEKFGRCVICSVVPEATARLLELLQDAFAAGPPLIVSNKIALGITVDYPKPSSIGADRLANAAAAAALHGAPAVVIDFGTAVTFDILDARQRYIGGVIAPGLEVMTTYLHERTALLPRIHLEEPPRIIGKSTREAMLAGAVHGYRGLVREILEEIRAEPGLGPGMKVIATGGYADLIAGKLPVIQTVDPDLTLQGLRIISNLNPRTPARPRATRQSGAARARQSPGRA